MKAMFGFIGSIFKLARGKFPCGALVRNPVPLSISVIHME